jgi:phospholipase/lecithinase/hemolysin
MQFQTLSLRAGAAAAVFVTLAGASSGAAAAYSGLYVFGDSLSDNGNLFASSGGTVPALPYVDGRFSNGKVAVEYLAEGLQLNALQFHDYAIGGAETGTGGSAGEGTGLTAQVNAFTAPVGTQADPGALYVVWAGANDLLHASFRDLLNPAKAQALIDASTTNLKNAVQSLYDDGARNFLLPTLPNLGLTPKMRDLGLLGILGAARVAKSFNETLLDVYGDLSSSLDSEHFTYFDAFSATNSAVVTIAGQGGNVRDSCIAQNPNDLHPDCTGFMFFDDIHPTTATHQMLGSQMLSAVPEPSSWLMMVAGVAGLLTALRRPRAA